MQDDVNLHILLDTAHIIIDGFIFFFKASTCPQVFGQTGFFVVLFCLQIFPKVFEHLIPYNTWLKI